MKKLSLLEVLEGIEDTRRNLSVQYPLHEVMFMFLVAVVCILRSPTAASAVANGSRAALSGSGNATRSSAAAERW